jgi:hypothetical protein
VTDEALSALAEAVAPLMDRDYCSPYMSAWELDPHGGPEHRDGEVIYVQVRAAWERAKGVVDA